MLIPAIRQLADWFSGTVTDASAVDRGVNACIDGLTLDGTDSAPPDVTVYDETRNALVARNEPPATLPAVIVSAAPSQIESTIIQPTSGPLSGPVRILVRVVLKQSDSDEGVEDAYYILRAVVASWQYFTRNQTKWTRGDTAIIPLRDGQIEWLGMDANRDDKLVSTALVLTVQVRITTP